MSKKLCWLPPTLDLKIEGRLSDRAAFFAAIGAIAPYLSGWSVIDVFGAERHGLRSRLGFAVDIGRGPLRLDTEDVARSMYEDLCEEDRWPPCDYTGDGSACHGFRVYVDHEAGVFRVERMWVALPK